MVKTYIRDAIQELEALGFTDRGDPLGRRGKRVFVHPNEPDVELRLYDGATEARVPGDPGERLRDRRHRQLRPRPAEDHRGTPKRAAAQENITVRP